MPIVFIQFKDDWKSKGSLQFSKKITKSEIWKERQVTGIGGVFLGNGTVYVFAYLSIYNMKHDPSTFFLCNILLSVAWLLNTLVMVKYTQKLLLWTDLVFSQTCQNPFNNNNYNKPLYCSIRFWTWVEKRMAGSNFCFTESAFL